MTALAAKPFATEAALLMVVLWAIAASLVPYVRLRWRGRAFWALVMIGVPVLGWLTFVTGPMIGLAAFAIGIVALLRAPMGRTRANPDRPRDRASPAEP
ncbi:DUF2484 family protein [Paracoccus sp. (in: a-proteobacteria)]|uniref:DUF2484 family protein n=1 Tax=Paracoccus sp. TaxID=267 RepID=UPI00289FFFF5|nr:DUF2484 family protein [Paracoccus sp. (in: a-proteobacteria)]